MILGETRRNCSSRAERNGSSVNLRHKYLRTISSPPHPNRNTGYRRQETEEGLNSERPEVEEGSSSSRKVKGRGQRSGVRGQGKRKIVRRETEMQ